MKIHADPITLLTLVFFIGHVEGSLALLAAILIHEAGHLIAAATLRLRIAALKLDLLGARLVLASPLLSYRKEWLLCAAGPAANLATLALTLSITKNPTSPFALALAGYAALNLLPIKSFDGGRMTVCLLAPWLPLPLAAALSDLLSFLCVFLLWSLSLYLLLRTGTSLSLFVFTLSLFSALFWEDKS